ncbi:MAG: phenylalanine--tRNA ligase subunit beta [Clostridia bacterium]|nr:phenylalanine--tRNA ligase subunit beta [Clostridia bacterium]
MVLSKRWLQDYLKLDVSDKEFASALTLSGSKVEGYETEGEELSNIVVGRIESLEKHPDSDHLWICKVNVGAEENLQIVTGAQNLKEGDYVPAALDNSVVAGGKKIKKGKLRGVESAGMLCSLGELGLTAHDFPYAIEDGIFVLGDDCDLTLGKDICEAIGLNDVVTEFEITSNRPDCLSVLGLAREAAVTYGMDFEEPVPSVEPGEGDVNDLLKVSIEAPELCYRYVGGVVKNVKIEPSPRWMRERLRASGVRPINNIVDITNFVMLEYGQPMHAFDLRYLDGNEVIVRNAKAGEKITTLDGIERELNPEMLVIADANKPVAVAGVMGGEYSGIMDDTNTIVFESACFNGPSIRMTAKALGMRTEASSRYDKQLDPKGCRKILNRALQLVQQLGAGEVVNGVVDCDCSDKTDFTLAFEPDWVNGFIGIDVSADEQKKILERLGCKVEDGVITVPSFRNDLRHKADISEEIARFYGYDNIPDRQLAGVATAQYTPEQKFERLMNETMLACGLSELCTFSFISPKSYDKICLPADSAKRNCVVITNPLGEDTSVMRTTLLPSMLETLSRNYNNRNAKAYLYEIGKEYIYNGADKLPDEPVMLCMGMYGADCNFFTIKGVVEELLEKMGIADYDVEAVNDNPSYHPGRTAVISKDGIKIGVVGEVHPQVLGNYSIGVKAYAAEISFAACFELSNLKRTYKQLPKFPALTRDLACVCEKSMPVLKLERAISGAVGNTLETIELFDVYEGSQIPEGMKSVAFSLKLRAADRTMTDEEADAAMKRAIKALDKLGVSLRA